MKGSTSAAASAAHQAMARHFSHCTGVDVAETMIEQATRLNPGSACTFVVNEPNDLGRFEVDEVESATYFVTKSNGR
jgi:hypothetical protein